MKKTSKNNKICHLLVFNFYVLIISREVIMIKLLNENEIKSFVKDFDIKEQVFHIMICLDNTPRYIINGETVKEEKLEVLKKYL